MTEWIANDSLADVKQDCESKVKQDCESKAFKRMAERLKKYFPRLDVCILADGLYSNVSIMSTCEKYGWKYTCTVYPKGINTKYAVSLFSRMATFPAYGRK